MMRCILSRGVWGEESRWYVAFYKVLVLQCSKDRKGYIKDFLHSKIIIYTTPQRSEIYYLEFPELYGPPNLCFSGSAVELSKVRSLPPLFGDRESGLSI